MPEETRKGVENIKKGEIDKRKKVWEEKEGPPTKKQKKMTAAQEERGESSLPNALDKTESMLAKTLAVAVEKREREAHEKAEKQRAAKEEAEQLAAEKKKKKPIRYPTEDLDIRMADKDKKAGMKLKRPVGNRANVPFNETPGASESFLMSWNFLIVYGSVNLWFTSSERYSNASIYPLVSLFTSQYSHSMNSSMLYDTPFLRLPAPCWQRFIQHLSTIFAP